MCVAGAERGRVGPPAYRLIAAQDAAHGVHDVRAAVWCARSGVGDGLATTGDDGLARVWKVAPAL